MEADMDATPSYFSPEDLSSRERFRRYRKRQSTSNNSPVVAHSLSKFSEAQLVYDGDNIQRRPNTALLLEEIKKEAESFDTDGFEGTARKLPNLTQRRASIDSHVVSDLNFGSDSAPFRTGHSLKSIKQEDEVLIDGGESTFTLFHSLLDSALQGLMPFPDLILRFEKACRDISNSIRYGSTGRHRVVEDKFLQQKARLLLDEAASWSLLWYLFGKGNEELSENLLMFPTTSHQEACQFVLTDHTAQLFLRIVLWLEGLASESLELEKKVRGSHVGSYLPSSGIWHHTQRYLKKRSDDPALVKHMDFDAPTREAAHLILDDKKQDELFLEDVWTLLRAGRVEEACELCRSAGQPWRAACLCPFGGFDQFPTIEAMHKNGKTRTLQAIELESGIGHQLRLWKWASYCASEKIAEHGGGKYEMAVYAAQSSNLRRLLPVCLDWESACWAMAKSWLDVQVDRELASFRQARQEGKSNGEDINDSSMQEDKNLVSYGTSESWPFQVLDQQPRDLPSLLQKLHSSEVVHESVSRSCKEPHRQIEMNLMLGDITQLLDLLWSWVSPSEDDQNILRPNADPQMIRFGAHVVLVLRHLLDDDVKDSFKEKLATVGDLILHMYAMFLFSKQHEELVGTYASQLSRHLCIDLFVKMMELRLNSSGNVKYKLFRSAMEYLPFSSGEGSKACFEDIIERVLARSRENKSSNFDEKLSDVAEQHRLQSLQKATVIQWLCFTPPSAIRNSEIISAKLLLRALVHSNTLFREFALISMWRVPKMPIGAHMLLSFLAEPLKQPTERLLSFSDCNVTENLQEFEDWREYYACDATYRNWLKFELDNAAVSPDELSLEEKDRATAAARETLTSSLLLLQREHNPWLTSAENSIYNATEHVYLELHATAMLCLPSGECMYPDATSCTTLTSALYSTVSEEDVVNRQLRIEAAICSSNSYCIEVALRCVAVNGDGLGFHEADDGGLLANVLAAGFKGELSRFQPGVTIEISRLDAWYSDEDGSLGSPATFIVKGLCRRCCLPEVILRCMQVSVSLAELGDSEHHRNELIELVASSHNGMLHLFSQHQLQELLLFERECCIYRMEFEEEVSGSDF